MICILSRDWFECLKFIPAMYLCCTESCFHYCYRMNLQRSQMHWQCFVIIWLRNIKSKKTLWWLKEQQSCHSCLELCHWNLTLRHQQLSSYSSPSLSIQTQTGTCVCYKGRKKPKLKHPHMLAIKEEGNLQDRGWAGVKKWTWRDPEMMKPPGIQLKRLRGEFLLTQNKSTSQLTYK